MNVAWIRWGAVAALLWGAAGPAPAKPPLCVTDFDSLGAFPSGAGAYVFTTSGTPTLQTPDGTIITGVVAEKIAVFTFDAIGIGDGMIVTASGGRPLALLSYSDVTIAGTGRIDVSGASAVLQNPGRGGPGGGAGGAGGQGGPGQGRGYGQGSGGGGFGGRGGRGAPSGGRTYGNLLRGLKGGSGGGGAFSSLGGSGGGGGGGGGALEIVALGTITVGGNGIVTMGGRGASSTRLHTNGGGGGSGGGVLLSGNAVRVNSIVDARGGIGGTANRGIVGGGGGGGQVFILYGSGGLSGTGVITVAGGGSLDSPGQEGRLEFIDVSGDGG